MKVCQSSKSSGFTIIELVIVMGIIAVLAAGAIGVLGGFTNTAKIQQTETDINSAIIPALKQYEILGKTYPSTEQGLEALVTKPTSAPIPRRHSSIGKLPLDAWQNSYNYENNGGTIRVYSNGPDGKADFPIRWSKPKCQSILRRVKKLHQGY